MADEKVGPAKAGNELLPYPSQTRVFSHQRTRLVKLLTIITLLGLLSGLKLLPTWLSTPRHEHNASTKQSLYGKRAESAFLSIPDPERAIAASRLFASKPHMAGTPSDLETAKDFLAILQRELGIPPPSDVPIFSAGSPESQDAVLSIPKTHKPRAWIDTYYPVMNTPLERSLQIVDKDESLLWEANLVELTDDTDPEAGKYFDAVPTFHGLSRAGDVTGKLVDGNYCTHEDYESLVQNKVNLTGTIVLCRYGGIFRGLKVKGGQGRKYLYPLALEKEALSMWAERGAVGVLIYSDPRDDGTVTVENGYLPYPFGPARNPTSVQRGSVQYLSVYPGDPTTPGYPSYENSSRTDGSNIPLIPSLPISWANAQSLLKTLTKGDDWEGKLVRLANNVDTRVIPIWNSMAVIPGFIKDQVVVVGNHRDAWVMGAADPSSGTASIHETIRGLGHLLRNGWKPLRTIVLASWDAEEYGLIGSTEWGEDFVDWIDNHVVAYINLDSSVSGSRYGASGSPLLANFIRETAEVIPHPTEKGRSLWEAINDDGTLFGNGTDAVDAEVLSMKDLEFGATDSVGVTPLGSGSDYTVFLQRNGVPSTNIGFKSTIHDPVYHYHSVFDSQRWQELYADPGFHRHVAVARHLGLQTLKLSSSPLLPFNTSHYAFELEYYLDRVERIAAHASFDVDLKSLRTSIRALQKSSTKLDKERAKAEEDLQKLVKKWKKHSRRHRRIKRAIKRALCKIKKALGKPCSSSCQHKDFYPVKAQEASSLATQHADIDEGHILGLLLHGGADDLDAHMVLQHGGHHGRHHRLPMKKLRKLAKRIQRVNKKLSAFERGFISESGIKDREWYKHLAVAPGKWLGYGATTLPGLTEAIVFDKNTTLAQSEAARLQNLIDKLAEELRF